MKKKWLHFYFMYNKVEVNIMTTKILFIDVDGTLVGIKEGQQYIPESAKKAIQTARQNGHLAFLCTGRSQAEIGDIMNIGFDGVIGGAGGYVLYDNNIIFHKRLNKDVLSEIMEYLDHHQVAYYLESNTGLYCNEKMMEYNHSILEPSSNFLSLCKEVKTADLNDINKVSFLTETLSYQEIEAKYKDNFYVVKASWGDVNAEAGEISTQGINKATAIHFLLDYLQLDDVETYGLGDSMNDIEMFNCVSHAIAMGEARHGVKEYAEFVTKSIDEDGIEFALKHYQLI